MATRSDFELLALMSALIAGAGRSARGAVAEARALLDELKAAEPETYQRHIRAEIAERLRSARSPGKVR